MKKRVTDIVFSNADYVIANIDKCFPKGYCTFKGENYVLVK